MNNSIISTIIKKNIINNSENAFNVKGYSYKADTTNNYKSHVGYVENNIYKRSDNRTSNNTSNTHKHIDKYSTDAFNNYKVSKAHNLKKTYYNSKTGVFINKHNTINANGTYNITKTTDLYNITDNNYYTEKSII